MLDYESVHIIIKHISIYIYIPDIIFLLDIYPSPSVNSNTSNFTSPRLRVAREFWKLVALLHRLHGPSPKSSAFGAIPVLFLGSEL